MGTFGVVLLVIGVVAGVVAFGVSSWRRSERSYERWRSRRGVDENPETFDDRGALRSHWDGWGRPGGGTGGGA